MEAQQYRDVIDRVCVMHTDYAKFDIEKNQEGLLFFHVEVYKWNKTIYKLLIEDMLDMLEQLKQAGVHNLLAVIDNPKLEKFATMFGWVELADLKFGRKLYGVEVE